ncbi:SusC/RagA family TonB-linked outer membrane protein [Lacibacter sp. H375]|uniref:SusC/RagA family TonB-linked outer membrane protein n=1 Tax=Lacibacter sp. H375 TaxID=3133424 RepID=UPI0030BF0F77
MKMLLKRLLLYAITAMCFIEVNAQEKRQVTGTVRDTDGNPVVAATVTEKGTTNSVTTDFKGLFSINVAPSATLLITSVGYNDLEIKAGSTSINVELQSVSKELQGVVVTALGIKRQKKSLGYAVQEVKGSTLVDAREPNLANTLTGVVAGLQVVRSSNGPAGSSKIILRGSNSLTGSNQPLIVVDGVPVDNFTGGSNTDYWNPSLDYGNGLADLNPSDIESITVLKGQTAAALYGSRAGNGAILVTTKTGKKQAGLGMSFATTFGFESVFTNPEMQNVFGQGSNGTFDATSGLSWGPKITGQQVTNWNGKPENLTYYNNVKNFYDKGFNQNYNLTFQQQFNNISVYSSFNRYEDKSMIPGAKLLRHNFTTRSVAKFGRGDKWTADMKVQYSNTMAQNRPLAGNNNNNVARLLYTFPQSLDITQFKAGTDQYDNMIWWNSAGSTVNPYWRSKNALNQDSRDRFILTGSLKYDIAKWLTAEVKTGVDMYTNNYTTKVRAGSPIATNGRYGTGKSVFSEANYSGMLSAKKDNLISKLSANAMVGGNLMLRKGSGIDGSANLVVPNLFSLGNAVGNPSISEWISEKRINSVFGTAGVNWDEYLYLDATFRNDWSSALAKANRSYFYPSISAAVVVSEMLDRSNLKMPSWFNYAKIRASYASVGNDMDPYQLYNSYWIGRDPNNATTAGRNSTLFDENVVNELIKSKEIGAELKFLSNRVTVDFSLYKNNATNQLINLPLDATSGYTSKKINAGNIQNKGYEVMVDARVINKSDFIWNVSANFSHNDNSIIDILKDSGVTKYALGGFDNLAITATAGEKYGAIYGTTFKRVTDDKSPYYGQLILNGTTGLPQVGESNVFLGNQQAYGLLGVTNTFGFKGITLSFLVDARFGGKMFSSTLAAMQASGTAAETVVNGARENFVVEGVVPDGSGYKKNTVSVTPQNYWTTVATTGNLGIIEANMYDASNVRLRNVQLSYQLPKSFLSKARIQKATVGVSCNNVWLISSHMKGLDPESVFATGTNALGFENASPPTSRTILFNLTLNF